MHIKHAIITKIFERFAVASTQLTCEVFMIDMLVQIGFIVEIGHAERTFRMAW